MTTTMMMVLLFVSLALSSAVAVVGATNPPLPSFDYFPRCVPLLELEFAIKTRPVKILVNFFDSRFRRRALGDFDKSSEIWSEISNVIRPYVYEEGSCIRDWAGGHSYRDMFLLGGLIRIDSGENTGSLQIVAVPETFEEWKRLWETNVAARLASDINAKFQELQEQQTPTLRWIRPPAPPIGLAEVTYELRIIGDTPSYGKEVTMPKPRKKPLTTTNLWQEMLRPFRSKPKLVADTTNVALPDEPRNKAPPELLGEAVGDAFDSAPNKDINPSTGRSILSQLDDKTYHVYTYMGTRNEQNVLRATKVAQEAMEHEAKKHSSWFEISFLPGVNIASMRNSTNYGPNLSTTTG